MPKFDLQAELKAHPPKSPGPATALDHPRVAEWLEALLALRAKTPITFGYIADKLTKGARMEGIIPPTAVISDYAVRRRVRKPRG